MQTYSIRIEDDCKRIYPSPLRLRETGGAREELGFTNYYMTVDGKPFYGVCGEFHYIRCDERYWEDGIIKMKMGGVNIVSTYLFWNLHEELEGQFDWTGCRNVRRFLELCRKHDVYAIIRIGPFDHGEIRNGGIPDWLFGRPFNIRSNDEGYLAYVKRWYAAVGEQVQGLLYKEGGPIIATQIENEHNHSSALWALTSGSSELWLNGGLDGAAHMLKLKELAVDAGLDTPFYTCTAWGGATAPVPEMLPLWGGYSHWPWIYYGEGARGDQEHPATPEYIFRDKHNNALPKSYNFEPQYDPEDYPYACCEMGGGMVPFYKYRFQFPYRSVPAMTLMKVAEGCNLIGYYMYHGGTNPKGKFNPYTNDPNVPKMSYDFNAMVGEFGQLRESYHMTRLQHTFFSSFGEQFVRMKTALPGDTSGMDPLDVDTLRYAVRSSGGAGYLFLNNFQDHAQTREQQDVAVRLELPGETLVIPEEGGMNLASGGFAMLPFNLDLAGMKLKYATAQLITRLEEDGTDYYFFFAPEGMRATYALEASGVAEAVVELIAEVIPEGASAGQGSVERRGGLILAKAAANQSCMIRLVSSEGRKVVIYSMTHQESLGFWKTSIGGRERILLTNAQLLVSTDGLRLESIGAEKVELSIFPKLEGELSLTGAGELEAAEDGPLFRSYILRMPRKEPGFQVERVRADKAVLAFEADAFDGLKEALMEIRYEGDIGYAFIDGEMVSDNFCNGLPWEIGLKRIREQLVEKGMYLYISPVRKGAFVRSQSTMAGWSEQAVAQKAELGNIRIVPVYEWSLKLSQITNN